MDFGAFVDKTTIGAIDFQVHGEPLLARKVQEDGLEGAFVVIVLV